MRNDSYKTAIRYTYKNGKFTINEGIRKSSFSEYGKILTGCTSLYLPERDDELAKRIFIEHMESRVAKAEAELKRATEQLRILKEEL